MKAIREYLRLLGFMMGLMIGIQLPSFVDQYGKSVASHFHESTQSLQAFQLDADKYFAGDLKQLIRHYQTNSDPIVIDGGESIATLVARNNQLTVAFEQSQAGILQAYLQAVLQPLPEIKNEVWHNYKYQIILDPAAMGWGLLVGFLLSAVVEFFLFWCIPLPVLCFKYLRR